MGSMSWDWEKCIVIKSVKNYTHITKLFFRDLFNVIPILTIHNCRLQSLLIG